MRGDGRAMAMQQERARKTRAAIVAAAAEEFGRRGYAAASVSTILTASRTTKGALYFHFDSKEQVALAVHATAIETLTTLVGTALEIGLESADAIFKLGDAVAELFDHHNFLMRAEFRLLLESGVLQEPVS